MHFTIPESCIRIKINLKITFLWCLKRFYDVHLREGYKIKLKQKEENKIYHSINSQDSKNLLSHFRPIIIFHPTWKRLKTRYFPMFPGEIEREHWHEIGLPFCARCPLKCYAYLNKFAGLFKYVWLLSGHQTLKGK